jgi:hypothetical protein
MSSVLTHGAVAEPRFAIGRDERFFLISSVVMAMVVFLGFGLNVALGRSTFAAPPRFHLHALLFMGWTSLFVAQAALAGTGARTLHRRLGWLAVVWMPLMVASGVYITASNVRQGRVPPFFEPAYFLVMNPMHILAVAGLVCAAVLLRRQTQWHRRLMFCSMSLLLAPAFGRLLPMPYLVPYAGIVVIIPCLAFQFAGVIRDLRKDGRVHPAWWWGIAASIGVVILIQLIAYGPLGLAIYEAVTGGAAGALPALEFPPVPAAG